MPVRAARVPLAAFWHSSEGLLARRLLLVLGVYTLLRAVFLVYYADLFRDLSVWLIVGAFANGVRFDLSAIAYSNVPFILMSLAPASLLERAWYRRTMQGLFVVVNGAFTIIMSGDVAYYSFTGTRVTMEIFAFADEAATQFSQLLIEFAGPASLAIMLVVTLGVFYPRSRAVAPTPRRWTRTALGVCGVLALAVLAARGGVQKKPLNPIHAFASGEHEIGVLTLNSAFTVLQSPSERALSPVHYFADDREAEAILDGPFGYAAIAAARGLPVRQNVVVIVLESMGSEFWGAVDRDVHLTPFLDSLATEGLFFRNNFANGRRSMDALPSILLGVPLLMGRSIAVSSYQGNEWRGLGDYLGGNGYRTSMFHGAVKGTMYFDAIAAMAGIGSFYPLEAYPDSLRDRDFDGHWGLFDEPSMQWAAEEMGRYQEPFFSMIFTISTHHPYPLPPQYQGVFPADGEDLHTSVRYLDLSVRRFFETVKDAPWYDHTLFILTGDHTPPQSSTRFDTAIGRFMVPLLLFHPGGKLPPIDATRVTQHVDLFPTILDYTGTLPARVPRFGRSLFGNSTGEAVLRSNETSWLVRKDVVLQRDPTGTERSFAFLGERTGTIVAGPRGLALAPELRTRLNAYVQHYTSSMIHNTFYTDPAERLGGAPRPAVP